MRARLATPPPMGLATEGAGRRRWCRCSSTAASSGRCSMRTERRVVPGAATLQLSPILAGEEPWDAAERCAAAIGADPAALLRLGMLDSVPDPSGDVWIPCVAAIPAPPRDGARSSGGAGPTAAARGARAEPARGALVVRARRRDLGHDRALRPGEARRAPSSRSSSCCSSGCSAGRTVGRERRYHFSLCVSAINAEQRHDQAQPRAGIDRAAVGGARQGHPRRRRIERDDQEALRLDRAGVDRGEPARLSRSPVHHARRRAVPERRHPLRRDAAPEGERRPAVRAGARRRRGSSRASRSTPAPRRSPSRPARRSPRASTGCASAAPSTASSARASPSGAP